MSGISIAVVVSLLILMLYTARLDILISLKSLVSKVGTVLLIVKNVTVSKTVKAGSADFMLNRTLNFLDFGDTIAENL